MEELRSNGLEPYAYKWDRTHNASQLQEIYKNLGNGEESNSEKDYVSISGRIVARRAFGKLAFLTLRDDSGIIQVFIFAIIYLLFFCFGCFIGKQPLYIHEVGVRFTYILPSPDPLTLLAVC